MLDDIASRRQTYFGPKQILRKICCGLLNQFQNCKPPQNCIGKDAAKWMGEHLLEHTALQVYWWHHHWNQKVALHDCIRRQAKIGAPKYCVQSSCTMG